MSAALLALLAPLGADEPPDVLVPVRPVVLPKTEFNVF
jgi:hypothetical protein